MNDRKWMITYVLNQDSESISTVQMIAHPELGEVGEYSEEECDEVIKIINSVPLPKFKKKVFGNKTYGEWNEFVDVVNNKVKKYMEKKNKYYTPDIEDIRIGYEFEYNGHFKHLPPQEWKKIVMDYEFFTEGGGWDNEPMSMYYLPKIKHYTEPENIRVSYLTKEQIEAEGWEEMKPPIVAINLYFREAPYIKGEYRMDYNFEMQLMQIQHNSYYKDIFYGKIKSINEFRWICKLLKI